MSKKLSLKILSLILLLPTAAMAHTGAVQTTGFLHGFSHPMGGMDHLLAMLAVGLWAVQIGGRALWIVPTTFVIVMMFGGVLGLSGIQIPFIEAGILASMLVVGALIAAGVKFPVAISAVIVGFFALFHGHAHGAEMPTISIALTYFIGFSLATALIHMLGMSLGSLLQKNNLQKISRFAGAAIVFSGIALAV